MLILRGLNKPGIYPFIRGIKSFEGKAMKKKRRRYLLCFATAIAVVYLGVEQLIICWPVLRQYANQLMVNGGI